MFLRFLHFAPLIASAVLPAPAALAQDAPDSDEPKVEPDLRDFTRGTSVVPSGHIQVDSRMLVTRSGDRREHSLGDTQIRVPLAERAELRLNAPPSLIERDGARSSGLDDSGIEARLVLSKTKKVTTAMTLPTGSRQVAERRFQPGAVLAASFSLSPRTELVLNLGGERPTKDQQRFSRYRLGVVALRCLEAGQPVFRNLHPESGRTGWTEPEVSRGGRGLFCGATHGTLHARRIRIGKWGWWTELFL